MTRSPTKFFFILALFFVLTGYVLYSLQRELNVRLQNNFPPYRELRLARFFRQTGQTDMAIQEYKDVIGSETTAPVKSQAYTELSSLLNEQKQGLLGLRSYAIYIIWILAPKLYILSAVFFLIWLAFLIISPLSRKSELVILPLYDFSGLQIGEHLPQLATDRLGELKWKFQNLSSMISLLAETLDVPVVGVIGDDDAINISAIVETALVFSGGPSNLPISRIFDSLRLWLEQPEHIVRGDLKMSEEHLLLHLVLTNRKSRNVEKSWSIMLARANEDPVHQVVDALIYPLVFHFGTKRSTGRWEALKALCDGLEQLDFYRSEGNNPEHLQKAKLFFEKATEIDPSYHLAIYDLGLLLLRLGEYELARTKFREVESLCDDPYLRQLAIYSHGVALFELSQEWSYKLAAKILTTLIEEADRDDLILMARSTLAMTYARLAERMKDGRDQLRMLAFEEVREIKSRKSAPKPILAVTCAAEGYLNINSGHTATAVTNFNEAISYDSTNVSCWIGLGDAHFKDNQKEKAVSAFRKAALLSPSSGYANYRLGNIYRSLGDEESAIEAYKSASRFPLAHLSLGKIYLAREDYDNALDQFRKAVEYNRRLADAWINIAWTICEMNVTDESLLKEAEDCARRSLQLEQNQAQVWHRYAILSRVLAGAKKHDKALIAAKKAAELAPNNPQARFYLAMAESAVGNTGRAVELAKSVTEIDRGEWFQEAQSLIKQLS